MIFSSRSKEILLWIVMASVMVVVLSVTAVACYRLSKGVLNEAPETIITSTVQEITADFIIIGGGSAGSVVAARLAEYGFETLLISSGSNDTSNPMMREKSQYNQLFRTPHFKHYLPSDPSPNLNQRILDVTVWNTLGGNSINDGGVERMMHNDWNFFINATDDQSYHHRNMSIYYNMVENFTSTTTFSTSENHGHHGPIKITQVYDTIFADVWKNVAQEMSETFTNDLAGPVDFGFSFEPSVFTNGLRSWSGDAYLTPAMVKYPHLKVMTGATATKFDVNEQTKRINSVLFVSTNGLFKGIARKEYILSAGTFYSPHLLMLSGIGDPEILRQQNISVKHNLKQVGKNLIDNGMIVLDYEAKDLPIGESIPVALINSQTSTTSTNPNLFFILKMNNQTKHLYVILFNSLPTSTMGSVSLHNSNPLIPPKITLDYLENQKDLDTFIDGINYCRRILSTNAIKQHGEVTEISPGLATTNLSTFIKDTIGPTNHFSGTCSMGGNAENSVVNSRFKVHGLDNLRIVDASIFPISFVPKTGPCLTIYALAEKAADILRQTYS